MIIVSLRAEHVCVCVMLLICLTHRAGSANGSFNECGQQWRLLLLAFPGRGRAGEVGQEGREVEEAEMSGEEGLGEGNV